VLGFRDRQLQIVNVMAGLASSHFAAEVCDIAYTSQVLVCLAV